MNFNRGFSNSIFKKILILFLIMFSIIGLIIYKSKESNTYPIQQIISYKDLPLSNLLESCNDNTFIFFDVDDTLISAIDVLPRDTHYPLFFKIKSILKHPSLLNKKIFEEYYSIIWEESKRFVIEPIVIEIIKSLKEKGCIVLGLTSMESSAFGIVPSMPEWRYQMLKKLGIEFSFTFTDTIFSSLPQYRNSYPMLYRGILCCNQQPKAKVLTAFLDYFKLSPQKIIYFEDYRTPLIQVAQECKKRHIEFQGYQYLCKQTLEGSWNTKRALLQVDYLMKNKRWLSDQDADHILKSERYS